MDENIKSEVEDIIIAVENDKIMGFIHIAEEKTLSYACFIPLKYAVIVDLYVQEAHRRRGIGTQLLEAAKQWAIVCLDGGSVYSGPFRIVEDEFCFYVENGIDPDDVLAGYALLNGEMIAVDAGMVLSDGPGYVCLVIEETDAEPFAYFDILETPEGEEGQAVYPLGYISQDTESETYEIHQFHHAMPQLWIVGECEDDEETSDGEEPVI